MFLQKKHKNGVYYWFVVESYRENGKEKQRTSRSLGRTENAYLEVLDDPKLEEYISEIEEHLDSESPLVYFGEKNRIADKIISILPEHETYVELFGSNGHVLAKKPQS